MDEQKQQRILRIIVFAMLVIGALGFLWYFAQGGELTGEEGILQMFQKMSPGGSPEQ